MVEAAGVEPASEIAVSQECPCCVRFRMFSPAGLRTDKMADKLVRLISLSAARTEPLKPAYWITSGSQPIGKTARDGCLFN